MFKFLPKVAILLFILFMVPGRAFMQTLPEDYGLSSKVPPTPTASTFAITSNYPVDDFTGTVKISIPIYEINVGSFKLPISLDYNSSGVKVEEYASWVGLGWSLNAGGVISRMINDKPDDLTDQRNQPPVPQLVGRGLLYQNFNDNYNASNPSFSDIYHIRTSRIDAEPDIFFYNFNGNQGKFVFSQGTDPNTNNGSVAASQHKILMIPYKDLKFSYTLNSLPGGTSGGLYTGGLLQSFDVYDELGNHYIFSAPESYVSNLNGHSFTSYSSETAGDVEFGMSTGAKLNLLTGAPASAGSGSGNGGSNNSNSGYVYTSWFLTQIVTVTGRIINFSYVPEQFTQDLDLTFGIKGFTNGGLGCANAFSNNGLPNDAELSYGTSTHAALRLSAIDGTDFKILFNANFSRLDLVGSNGLSNIQVFSKDANGNVVLKKEFDFSLSYFQSTATSINNSPGNGNPELRLRLDKITETGSDGTSKPPTVFVYNNAIPLPSRHSMQRDFFGYFNNNSCASLIPTIYVYNSLSGNDRLSVYQYSGMTPDFTIPGADRTVNSNSITSGTLTSITYPTGGVTTFTYEPTDFYYRNTRLTGGGVRVLKVSNYDGINHANDIIKNYTYTDPQTGNSTGVLFNMPIFAYTENMANYWSQLQSPAPMPLNAWGEWPVTDINYYTHNMIIVSNSIYASGDYGGHSVGYSQITQSTPGKGKTVSYYSTPARFGDLNDLSNGACAITVNGYCDGLYQVPTPITVLPHQNGSNPVYTNPNTYTNFNGVNLAQSAYPFAPNLNYEWNRGFLMTQNTYNSTGQLVKSVTNNYITYTPNGVQPSYTYGLKTVVSHNYEILQTNPIEDFYLTERYAIISNVAKILASKTTVAYDQNNSANALSSVERYSYASAEMLPNKIETTTSKGDLSDRYFTYPLDYNNLSSPSSYDEVQGLVNLQARHIISPVVETYTMRKNIDGSNARVVNAYLTAFAANIPLPQYVYRSESAIPLTSFTPATITNTSGIIKDASYNTVPFLSFDGYDQAGNLLQQHKLTDINSAYIWDYNNIYPVASVSNAAQSEIAFTSFEADGVGNWGIGSSLRVSGGVTGNKAYVLGNGNITATLYNTSKPYIVSYWSASTAANVNSISATQGPTRNGWTYYEHKIPSGTSIVTVSGSVTIDELRLYPSAAQMTTYTYIPLVGMSSQCDINNRITYYVYDGLQRLTAIKDQDGNVVKKICYSYAGQTTACPN